MAERTPDPDAQARLTTGPHDPVTIEKADGSVWRLNVPRAGMVTVRHPDGRMEEFSVEELVERERARS